MTMRYQGRITSWKDDQGFGFITPSLGGEPVFVHINAFAKQQRRPAGSETVSYELASDGDGRPQARNVVHVSRRRAGSLSHSTPSPWPLIITTLFLVFIVTYAFIEILPLALAGLYIGASIVTFTAYCIDKAAARKKGRRIEESTLHLLALIGGWPGALVAQSRLRHKTRKPMFQLLFWISVLVNCSFLGWLLTAESGETLRAALEAF